MRKSLILLVLLAGCVDPDPIAVGADADQALPSCGDVGIACPCTMTCGLDGCSCPTEEGPVVCRPDAVDAAFDCPLLSCAELGCTSNALCDDRLCVCHGETCTL